MSRNQLLLLLAACLLSPLAAADDAVQSLDSIRMAAAQAARAALQPLGGDLRLGTIQIDSRLRVAVCAAPLQAQLDSPAAARSIIAVHCEGPVAWTLRVPVQAEVWRPVAVLTNPLGRGALVGADQVRMQPREVLGLSRGYFGAIDQVVGRQARRNLKANDVLNPGMIEAARLVKRGDLVVVSAEDGRIAVRSQGIALQDGAEGASVRVRNARSGRVVSGEVTARGTVSVIP